MSGESSPLDAFERGLLEKHFDRSYYLSAHGDVAAAGIDPLLHYHVTGWREGRNPSRIFDTRYYLRCHGDIAAAGINPLLHYALSGQAEGRVAIRPLDAWRQRLDDAASRPSGAAICEKVGREEGWIEGAELGRFLRERMDRKRLIVSVSHDDYAESVGGVQNLISDERRAAAELGWHYLHVAPVHHRVTLAPNMPPHAFGLRLRLDSENVAHTDMETFLSVLADLRHEVAGVDLVIHHMMAHAPELLLELVRASGVERPLVWAHDFFIVCPSYALLRNDVVFCGGPPPASPACTICHYGEDRQDHLRRMRAFFEATCPVLIAPSASALEQWEAASSLPVSASVVLPLGRLLIADSGHRRPVGDVERPLRVAHIGARVFHKGWPAFEDLAQALRDDRRYRFYQLGRADGPPLSGNIHQVFVEVAGGARGAMIEAVARHAIDVVVSWSFWPETFCFAAHEAIAGGAFVLTNAMAGNVPAMLSDSVPRHGLVLKDAAALTALLRGDELTRRLAGSRRSRAALLLSDGTIGWIRDALEARPSDPAGTERKEAMAYV